MLYLEDYLEMIEHLPQELRDRFTEMRELDLQVNSAVDHLNDRVKVFFPNAENVEPTERDAEYEKIRQDYYKTLGDADEKVQIADQMLNLGESYIRRLDLELAKFKLKLEARNPGVTELLEKRSLELDNCLLPTNSISSGYPRRKRHKHTHQNISLSYNPDIQIGAEFFFSSVATKALRETIEETRGILRGLSPSSSSTSSTSSAQERTIVLPPQMNASFGSTIALAAAASQAIAATQRSLKRSTSQSQRDLLQQRRRRAGSKTGYEAAVSLEKNLGRELTPGDREINSPVASVPTNITSTLTAPHEPKTRVTRQTRSSRSVSPALGDSKEEVASGWNDDPGEPRYCFCNQISYGDMVACDNKECPFEWFHYKCVGMTQSPRGEWFCLQCSAAMKIRNRK